MNDYECYCEPMEGECADVWRETWHTAKKDHICIECKDKIIAGQKYQRVFMVFEGTAESFKTCQFCASEYDRLITKYHGDIMKIPGELACVLVWDMRGES